MNRRILFTVVAAVAAIGLTNTSRADAALFGGLFASNGGACEAYAGCDSGPTDCGGCAAKSCCKPTKQCCAPKPRCSDPCNSRCTPILDYLRNLLSPCCESHCESHCDAPAPSCGCGG